jgi:hypothetical protein
MVIVNPLDVSLRPSTLIKCRALSFHLFGAATLLISEWSSFPIEALDSRREELRMAIKVLDSVGNRNAIASRASSIVQARYQRLRNLPMNVESGGTSVDACF